MFLVVNPGSTQVGQTVVNGKWPVFVLIIVFLRESLLFYGPACSENHIVTALAYSQVELCVQCAV